MSLLSVFTTVAQEADADALARGAVEKGLAACVQAERITSTYRWKGQIEQEGEIRLMFKTTAARYAELERWLMKEHPYELPAIFALPVHHATDAYTAWVEAAVQGASDA